MIGLPRKHPFLVASLAFLVLCFAVYWLFVDKLETRTYQDHVTIDGKGPWEGSLGPPFDAPDAVLLYRSGRNGVICYDSFHSKELRERLLSKNGQQVKVEYDTFSDFGKVRGYNLHSVDGIILANGYHVLRSDFAGGAGVVGVAGFTGNTLSGDDCW
jgi:hypothetical protein